VVALIFSIDRNRRQMPCYRCGTRQVHPARCSSPWLRGVRADRQVLICPGCQADGQWITGPDRCALCASIHLVRRLGEVECRDCGALGAGSVESSAEAIAGAGAGEPTPAGLAEEVEHALARVLRWPSARHAGIG
jgi:hypothetical protein